MRLRLGDLRRKVELGGRDMQRALLLGIDGGLHELLQLRDDPARSLERREERLGVAYGLDGEAPPDRLTVIVPSAFRSCRIGSRLARTTMDSP